MFVGIIIFKRLQSGDRNYIYNRVLEYLFRFSAVCRPFSYRAASRPENVDMRVFKYIFFVIIFSCIINISRFFETKFVTRSFNISSGDTFESGTRLSFDVTALRRDPNYIRSVYFLHIMGHQDIWNVRAIMARKLSF